jgi:hypothetical protein
MIGTTWLVCRLRELVVTFTCVAAVTLSASACGRVVPIPSPTPSQLPSPRIGGPACPPAAAESTLLERLAEGGIKVSAASASTDQTLFRQAATVCLMDVGNNSFEVAFFPDNLAASGVRVCESRSGSRYLYQVDGQTVDSAYPVYWSVSGNLLIWTNSSGLDASVKRALSGVRPQC